MRAADLNQEKDRNTSPSGGSNPTSTEGLTYEEAIAKYPFWQDLWAILSAPGEGRK